MATIPDSVAIPELSIKITGKVPSADQKSLLSTVSVEESKHDDSTEDMFVMVSTYAPSIKNRVPSDIVLVVDVSGSMGNDATTQGVEYSGLSLLDIVKHAVKTVISTLTDKDRLALVSYSNQANTVFDLMTMDTVGKENAVTMLDRLNPGGMTNLWDGLKKGMDILKDRILPGGSQYGNNGSILLLTDGEPNIEPPRGHIPMLKRYCDANGGRYPGIISTFGFGYQLDSTLLRQVAVQGGGMYAFIPDSGFVGTAFVNSLANILSTVTTDAVLQVTIDPEMGITMGPEAVMGNIPCTQSGETNNILTIPLGSVQTGQTRDTLIRLRVPKSAMDAALGGSPVGPLISATLVYHPNRSHTYSHILNTALPPSRPMSASPRGAAAEGKDEGKVGEEKDSETDAATRIAARGPYLHVESTVGSTQNVPTAGERSADGMEIDYQLLKWVGVQYISKIKNENIADYHRHFDALISAIAAWTVANKGDTASSSADDQRASHPEQGSVSDRMQGLREDYEGQVLQALSRLDWWSKWGKHYLQSLQRAHELQQCNNFKDPGVQFYGGSLFRSIRDFADDQFCSLPAPVPKPKPAPMYSQSSYSQFSGGGQGAPAAPVPSAPINMASFNSRDQPCFHGDCTVSVCVDGVWAVKAVHEVRRGDRLEGGVVRCVVRTDCPGGRSPLVSVGAKGQEQDLLLVTPWHPVQVGVAWVFPADVGEVCDVACEAVYSFLIEVGSGADSQGAVEGGVKGGRYARSVTVSGVRCLALAHGIADDVVAAHPFFGTTAVVSALMRCEGWGAGLVRFGVQEGKEGRSSVLTRDEQTGLVVGFAR